MHALKREETIAVGDRDIDILAGQAAGLFTCLFGAGTGETVPELTIHTFDELYQAIQSSSA